MGRANKKIGVIVLSIVIMAIVILSTIIMALDLGYEYSPTKAYEVIKEGEMCELTIEYSGATGMPEKEVKYVEAFSVYTFPKIEREGFKFFCWFCNYAAYQESVPIYAKKIRAIAQFEKDYSIINAPCALYDTDTSFIEYQIGEYADINKKVSDIYVDGGYKVTVF